MHLDPSAIHARRALPENSTESALRAAVLAQAILRMKLGIPIWALMLLCILIWGPASAAIDAPMIATVFGADIACKLAMLLLARRARLPAGDMVRVGAVLDPLMLSAGLALTGEPGQIFIGFYLFTILGYGFRIGPDAMRLCQLAALAGFSAVALFSPAWHAHPVTPLSVLALLAVVPLYARVLIGRLRAAQALAESESRAKSQLLANVSHELRTPLTGIMSSAQLLREAQADAEVWRRCDAILTLSRDLMLQIDELLDSARHEAGALRLTPAPVSLHELAENLRCTLAPTAHAKDIALTIEVDPRLPPRLLADAHYLKRALLNIGGNAVKFTDHGAVELRIALVEADEADEAACIVHFSCRDTGIGIAPDIQQRIFEPFFQASSGITRKYGGTGLGMSIARDIIALMGGVLGVISTPGAGSLFEFTLRMPIAADAADTIGGASAAPLAPPIPRRILIADDNATNLLLLQEALQRDGHQAVAARSGREALAALSTTDFDLVILDYNMGDLDGATVLQLYHFGCDAAAPVYILTADVTAQARLADIGAAGILHKPIDVDALRQAAAMASIPVAATRARKAGAEDEVDAASLQNIRALSDDPAFLEEVLSTAAADIERLTAPLLRAVQDADITAVRECAHALLGVCASVGARRLAGIAGQLLRADAAQLRRDAAKLCMELEDMAQSGVQALQDLRSRCVR